MWLTRFQTGRRLVVVLGVAAISAPLSAWSQDASERGYSTCPDVEHAVIRSVLYREVTEPKLLKWAKVKVYPKKSTVPEIVRVRIQVEGERVFCAEALDGPAVKQKIAVDSALRWRFKKNRGDFNDSLIGTLRFRL